MQAPEGDPTGGGSTAAAPVTPSAAPSSAPSTASPASTPSATPSGEKSEGTPVDAFDFGALVDNAQAPDDDTVTAVAPKAATPVVPPAAAPAASAVVAPVVPPQAAAVPPTQPAGQPPVPASADPAATQAPQAPPEQFDVAKHRAEFLPKLESLYKLNDAEVAELSTNPGEAMPKLAARLHYEVQLAVHQGVLQIIPHLFQNLMESQRETSKNDNAFYDRWPELKEAVGKDSKIEGSIKEAVRSYKALNPKANTQDIIEKAGLLAMISLGIPPRAAAAMVQQAMTPVPVLSPAPSQIPGRPAGVGATAHVPAPRAPGNEQGGADLWGSLAEHHLSGGG